MTKLSTNYLTRYLLGPPLSYFKIVNLMTPWRPIWLIHPSVLRERTWLSRYLKLYVFDEDIVIIWEYDKTKVIIIYSEALETQQLQKCSHRSHLKRYFDQTNCIVQKNHFFVRWQYFESIWSVFYFLKSCSSQPRV